MADYSTAKTDCKRCHTPDIEWDADDLANCLCYDCLVVINEKLRTQLKVARELVGSLEFSCPTGAVFCCPCCGLSKADAERHTDPFCRIAKFLESTKGGVDE